ncbi:MAG TPA: hypothetical protein VF414_10660 [Thermoanaerobaculia bacterium]
MGSFADWLFADEQKDLLEFLVALVLFFLFLALAALLLWPFGKLALAGELAQGYGMFWFVLWVTSALAGLLQRLFRMNLYDRSTGYIVSGLSFGAVLQMGWSAFAAVTVQGFVAAASFWAAAVLYGVGALSCVAAFFAVSSIYQGALYRLVNLPLSLVSFLVFSVWPGAAGALYGWVFRLF